MTERSIDTELWTHPDYQQLSTEAKLLYLYSFTNSHCNAAGLYRISPRTMAFETGLNEESLPQLFTELKPLDVVWLNVQSTVWVKEFLKHQNRSSIFLKAVASALDRISDRELIGDFLRYNETISVQLPSSCQASGQPEQPESGSDGNCPYHDIINLWRELVPSLPKPDYPKSISPRAKAINARWKENRDLAAFRDIFVKVETSDFLKGNNDRGWKCNIDWVLKPGNWQKIKEDIYNGRAQGKQPKDTLLIPKSEEDWPVR